MVDQQDALDRQGEELAHAIATAVLEAAGVPNVSWTGKNRRAAVMTVLEPYAASIVNQRATIEILEGQLGKAIVEVKRATYFERRAQRAKAVKAKAPKKAVRSRARRTA